MVICLTSESLKEIGGRGIIHRVPQTPTPRIKVKFSGLVKSRGSPPPLLIQWERLPFCSCSSFLSSVCSFGKSPTVMFVRRPGWASLRYALSPKEPWKASWRQVCGRSAVWVAGSRGPYRFLRPTQLERAALWCVILTLKPLCVLKESSSTRWYWSSHSQPGCDTFWVTRVRMNRLSLLSANNSEKAAYTLFAKNIFLYLSSTLRKPC